MNGATIIPESTNSSPWRDYETVLFDVLEALKPHFPQLAGGFARMTGGVDGEYIVSELRSVLATAPFQKRVQPWLLACFGELIAGDREERNHRFLEEALELVQSCGCTAHEAHQLVDYVYDRPAGQPSQEVGGVMVTLAALCLANDLDMHTDAETELARIWTKVDAIRAKQAAKPKHSPLPESTNLAVAQGEPGRLSEIETKRASDMLDLFTPLSISSTWEPSERRTIIRAMLAYRDIVAGVTHTERDAIAASDAKPACDGAKLNLGTPYGVAREYSRIPAVISPRGTLSTFHTTAEGNIGSRVTDATATHVMVHSLTVLTLEASHNERFRRLVERIAAWTDEELAVVDAAQCRHVARVVIEGADPVYPPFGPSSRLHEVEA